MNRLRIGFALTTILGTLFGFTGLFSSITEFSIGIAVAGAGLIGYGLCDWLDNR